ncbi:cell envelope integrity protein CreD [Flavihumibacter sp. CACIAM 22H1]|uniref:cell envelope integrity protein CreD n=1 Tax=Flavihumibacter sp. CACIAM 22H1 TaxID=1812911 RepID=UPI0007A84282|nr:cell envelope integrity protein CreD [Flavihumibacter sp. CACIAM 22H1]KYP15538.1 MAG: hypothetical protein A1D16_21480 [Flavihumibacter sp. CACIAM 22H1]
MKCIFSAVLLPAAAIWIKTALLFGSFLSLITLFLSGGGFFLLLLLPATFLASLPAFIVLYIGLSLLLRFNPAYSTRLKGLVLLLVGILLVYSFAMPVLAEILGSNKFKWALLLGIIALLFLSVIGGCYLSRTAINQVLSADVFPVSVSTNYSTSYQSIMQQELNLPDADKPLTSNSPILYKGIITGVLILLMMVPTLFISSLVQERKGRQQEIVQEVSQRWAGPQKLSGLFLVIPYEIQRKNDKGKETTLRKELVLLPEDLQVISQLNPIVRKRSIYEVLLYRTQTSFNGYFNLQLPKDLQEANLVLKDASVCMGLSDIKGIEEKLVVQLGKQYLELSPGSTDKELLKACLSAPVDLRNTDISKLEFNTVLQLKGSEQLHFIPMAGNSRYQVRSAWPNPSFDGITLPAEHLVKDSGFTASWTFSKANLPFGTILRDKAFPEDDFSFGVSMIQPADQYAKTERCVKYALLFIGLTFSLFLVMELMQKKPVHPIQYVLVGIALSVFYTLLLSLSELVAFEWAYGMAAAATIALITLYVHTHFSNWKTASLFGFVLTCLYGFAFILVRLEDTALLVGSIGLFLILALVMFGTRKINWYPEAGQPVQTKPVL